MGGCEVGVCLVGILDSEHYVPKNSRGRNGNVNDYPIMQLIQA